MTAITFAVLASLSLISADDVIDDFRYTDDRAAREVWIAGADRGESIPLTVVRDQGREIVQVPAPFAARPDLGRVYLDREVNLDLAAAGQFQLVLRASSPEAAGSVTLYFHSQDGWYAAGSALVRPGWNTLQISKASFGREDQPAGWHTIDRIRIAFWRGSAENLTFQLAGLKAVHHEVALIIPGTGRDQELATATRISEDLAQMVADLGLGSDAIEDSALQHGALGQRRVAILGYNPSLTAEAVGELVRFVEGGGKLFVCYQLPEELGRVLGFGRTKYVRETRTGQFAEIHFSAPHIVGLPEVIRQASWNIMVAQPTDHRARVIGRWYDQEGMATGDPALLVSDRGAFFSHIVLRDDLDGKRRMLAAVLGYLEPALWEQMARSSLDRVGQVGHLEDFQALCEFLTSSERPEVTAAMERAVKGVESATADFERQVYAAAVDQAESAREQMIRAYQLAQPSFQREGRAFWNHSGTGAYDGDWKRTARELSAAGFNMILPNMLWGGVAHYPSDVLPRSRTYEKLGDQIEQCVTAAHQYGLEVHVWKVDFNLSGAPREFVENIRREARQQVSVDGKDHDWLCPSHPENFQLELASLLEVARNYAVDGLHFDYIRYPDRDKCYCSGCRQRFEEQTGRQVNDWPADCYSGPLRDEYTHWRCDQITRLVKAVHEQGRALRPELKISAAVFGAYPACRESVAQDWPEWVKAGYLDFICPMDYTQSDLSFIGLVRNQLRLVEGRIPVYPGIGQWRLSDDRTIGQIHHARDLGAAGFTVFNLTRDAAESVVPAIGAGVGRQKATTPHQ